MSEAEATDFFLRAVCNENKDILGTELSNKHEIEENDKFCARKLSPMHGIEEQDKSFVQELSAMEKTGDKSNIRELVYLSLFNQFIRISRTFPKDWANWILQTLLNLILF